MLIASDLLLLLTDDRTGKLRVPSSQLDVALGGALLLELAIAGRVTVGGDARLTVLDTSTTADPVLDDALSELSARREDNPKAVVRMLGKDLRPRLTTRLAAEGILREERGRILGLVPTSRWPSTDSAHEDSVRALLAAALREGSTSDVHVAALVSLLHALKAVGKVVAPAELGLTKQELKINAERIADGDWASKAVRDAIDAMLAAIIAATSSSAVVASGGA